MSRGFTLVELMVVIVILGGLVAIVGPNVIGHVKDADVKTARVQMAQFAQAIELFYMDRRTLPAGLAELAEARPEVGEPYMKSIPRDSWGRPYELRRLGGREYEIVSLGEDGQEGTPDDVRWPPKDDD